MRVTVRGGHGYASHNDRTQQQDPKVVHPELTAENWYIDYKHDEWSHTPYQSFKELELEYYREHYGQALEEKNKKYLQHGNHAKVKSIEQLYASERKKPHEQIIQIGNHKDELNRDDVTAIMNGYIAQLQHDYGNHMKILDCAIHNDELTPHVHIRYVMEYDGEINQERALQALGFQKMCTRQDTDKIKYSEKPRYNSRVISFQKKMQEQLYDIVEKYYDRFYQKKMELERQPLLPTEKVFHTTNHEYYARLARDLEQQKQELQMRIFEQDERTRQLNREQRKVEKMKNDLEQEMEIIKKSKTQYKIYQRNKEQDERMH